MGGPGSAIEGMMASGITAARGVADGAVVRGEVEFDGNTPDAALEMLGGRETANWNTFTELISQYLFHG